MNHVKSGGERGGGRGIWRGCKISSRDEFWLDAENVFAIHILVVKAQIKDFDYFDDLASFRFIFILKLSLFILSTLGHFQI